MSAVTIIPTTGAIDVEKAVESVLNQSYKTKCYVVVDGASNLNKLVKLPIEAQICVLPENVGANGFYGHRIYAGFSHLVNEDYVLFLDQDCWFDPHHVEYLVDTIKTNNCDWAYSLRKIMDSKGNFIIKDNCESLGKWKSWQGYHLIDTNTYCIKREILIRLSQVWHGGWGQDRVFFQTISQYFQKFECSGYHSVNYRLGGNEGSVKSQFFEQGNIVMEQQYKGTLPWVREI